MLYGKCYCYCSQQKNCHQVERCVNYSNIKRAFPQLTGQLQLCRLGLGVKCGSVEISKLKCTLLCTRLATDADVAAGLTLETVALGSICWELTYHLCIIDTKFDVFNFFLFRSSLNNCRLCRSATAAAAATTTSAQLRQCALCHTRKLHFI